MLGISTTAPFGRAGAHPAGRVLAVLGAIALTAALLSGCRSTPGPELPGEAEADSSRGFGEFDEGPGSLERRDLAGGGSGDGRLEAVYFDFDSAAIRRDMRPVLEENARRIREAGYRRVVLEGHTDERGSEQYNLALGERRAHAVKRYLVQLGIPGTSLETVSFGESSPAVQGHDERAWKWNRRVEFRAVP